MSEARQLPVFAPATPPSVLGYLDPREFLKALFDFEKSHTEGGATMSYERFSERLGFGANAYSHLIISGRRAIKPKTATKIATALAFNDTERTYFEALCGYHDAKNLEDREAALAHILAIRSKIASSDLGQAQIEYFSEWYHAVVRELVALPDFKPDAVWIAERLAPHVSVEDAAYSFGLLQRIGYVAFDAGSMRWRQAQVTVSSGADVRSLALQRFHRQMADRAKDAVFLVPASEREFGALTVALSPEGVKRFKRRLRHIRSALVEELTAMGPDTAQDGDRVYQLNIQLFPLTRKP